MQVILICKLIMLHMKLLAKYIDVDTIDIYTTKYVSNKLI